MVNIGAIIKPLRVTEVRKALVAIGVKGMHISHGVRANWFLPDSWLRRLSGTAGIIWGIFYFSG